MLHHQSDRSAQRDNLPERNETGNSEYPEHDACGRASTSPAYQIQAAFDPCHVLRAEGCSSQHAACHGNPLTPQHPRGLSAFFFLLVPPLWTYPVFLSSGVDGTETHAALYSDQMGPAHFLSKTHTHTYQCFESRTVSTPSPWSNPPTKRVPPPPGRIECSERGLLLSAPALKARPHLCHLSLKGEGENRSWGAMLPSPEGHSGASMALEAQCFICIS